jgi:hypothetical protein
MFDFVLYILEFIVNDCEELLLEYGGFSNKEKTQ